MATSDLIAFVRARLDNTVAGISAGDAIRKIVDEYERVTAHYAKVMSAEDWAMKTHVSGHLMGLEHAVVAIANMWRGHPDWREGWW